MGNVINKAVSKFNHTKSAIQTWFNDETLIDNNISFEQILKSFIFIIPIHSILYLTSYYKAFGIEYFLYFNPVDLLRVFYNNTNLWISLGLVFGLLLFQFIIADDSVDISKFKANNFIFFAILGLFFFLLLTGLEFKMKNFFILFLTCLFVIGANTIKKQARLLYISIIMLFLYFTSLLANNNALNTKKDKLSFNIILNDDSYLLKESNKPNRDYFIGKVTDYVFIYSQSLKKIRVIPTSQIKEVQLPIKK